VEVKTWEENLCHGDAKIEKPRPISPHTRHYREVGGYLVCEDENHSISGHSKLGRPLRSVSPTPGGPREAWMERPGEYGVEDESNGNYVKRSFPNPINNASPSPPRWREPSPPKRDPNNDPYNPANPFAKLGFSPPRGSSPPRRNPPPATKPPPPTPTGNPGSPPRHMSPTRAPKGLVSPQSYLRFGGFSYQLPSPGKQGAKAPEVPRGFSKDAISEDKEISGTGLWDGNCRVSGGEGGKKVDLKTPIGQFLAALDLQAHGNNPHDRNPQILTPLLPLTLLLSLPLTLNPTFISANLRFHS